MNIFVLDLDPKVCAQYHCDSHVVKMILEYTQLLSTAHYFLGTTLNLDELYKPTHQNHPCALWVRAGSANYRWLHKLTEELCKEFRYRRGKAHKVEASGLLRKLRTLPTDIPKGGTPFAQAMPEDSKEKDVVVAYRNYYMRHKTRLLIWTRREAPEFILDYGFRQFAYYTSI